MFKSANIHDILKNHPDFTAVRKNIGAAELIKTEIKKLLPQTIQNKLEIVLAAPQKLTIFVDNQIIGAKIRQKIPSILRQIQKLNGGNLIESIDIKVAPTDMSVAYAKQNRVRHSPGSLESVEQMKAKLIETQS
jgi:hypothetical protein